MHCEASKGDLMFDTITLRLDARFTKCYFNGYRMYERLLCVLFIVVNMWHYSMISSSM